MNAFVQTRSQPAFGHGIAAITHNAIRAVRRWEARRLAAARVQNMPVGQLRSLGLRGPQALAVRYGVPIPAAEE